MQREELAFEIAVLGEEFEGFDGEGVLLRVKGEEKAVRFAIFRDELEEGVEFGFRVGDDIGESNSVVEGDALRFSSRREGISAEERTGEGEGDEEGKIVGFSVGVARLNRSLEIRDGGVIGVDGVFEGFDLESVFVVQDAGVIALAEERGAVGEALT